MENLFTEEPVKSLREYFDVYMINAVSENNDFGMGYKTAFSCKLTGGNSTTITGDDASVQVYVGKVLKEEKRKNSLAVVVLNTSAYAGTTYFGYQDGNGKFIEFAIAYCPVIESLESEYFRQVLVHEAIGHGFGKLEDEYVYPEKEVLLHWKCSGYASCKRTDGRRMWILPHRQILFFGLLF